MIQCSASSKEGFPEGFLDIEVISNPNRPPMELYGRGTLKVNLARIWTGIHTGKELSNVIMAYGKDQNIIEATDFEEVSAKILSKASHLAPDELSRVERKLDDLEGAAGLPSLTSIAEKMSESGAERPAQW